MSASTTAKHALFVRMIARYGNYTCHLYYRGLQSISQVVETWIFKVMYFLILLSREMTVMQGVLHDQQEMGHSWLIINDFS